MHPRYKAIFLLVLILAIGWGWTLRPQSLHPAQVSFERVQAMTPPIAKGPEWHSGKSPFLTTSFESQRPETARKIQILNEIFQSKNDNDPRLDRDFNQLTLEEKQALEQQYDQLSTESRNERGTIVFLIGKNLSTQKDFDFL